MMRTEPPRRFKKINKELTAEEIFTPFDTLQLLGARSLGQLKLPRSKRHWGRFIMSGHLGMIHGWRGIGKSLFSLGLGVAMASGVEFLGRAPTRPRKVIIMDGEMDLRTLQIRSRQVHNSMGLEPTNSLKFVSPELFSGIMPRLTTPEGQKAIDSALGENWDVLIIDNYSAFSSGREDADAWAPWNCWLLRHKRAGRTVIVIHHTGKSGTQRGASNHEDAMDFVMALRAPKVSPTDGSLQIVVSWTKSRHLSSKATQPFQVTFRKTADGTFEWSKSINIDADPTLATAKKLRAEGKTLAVIARELGKDKSTISRWLSS